MIGRRVTIVTISISRCASGETSDVHRQAHNPHDGKEIPIALTTTT
jgi:hypothetical protein